MTAIDWISRESLLILAFPVAEEWICRFVFLWGDDSAYRNLVPGTLSKKGTIAKYHTDCVYHVNGFSWW